MSDINQIQLDALRTRVQRLERFVKPLVELDGLDGELIGDQAVVAFVAESVGSTLRVVSSRDKRREACAARTRTAQILARKAGWSQPRIARNLGCSQQAVGKMLKQA